LQIKYVGIDELCVMQFSMFMYILYAFMDCQQHVSLSPGTNIKLQQ